MTNLLLGDNIESLKKLEANSVDSVVTDPPYGLSFMNKKWDHQVPSVDFWKEVYRVLKPGGHVLSFGGTRTYHRMTVNIEDAGFEIRDQIMWLYGSGFPKSHNIGKSVDKINGLKIPKNNMRVVNSVGIDNYDGTGTGRRYDSVDYKSKNEWEGWGTALKPANEPICVARKPLSEKTIVDNVLRWGTGGINIDGCRIATDDFIGRKGNENDLGVGILAQYDGRKTSPTKKIFDMKSNPEGRFPANIIFDEEAGAALDEQSGILQSGKMLAGQKTKGYDGPCMGKHPARETTTDTYGDKGGASRFFYCAKVSKKERNMGLDDFEAKQPEGLGHGLDRICSICEAPQLKPCDCEDNKWVLKAKKNTHPTVKPISLMAYLCRLITPPNGIVLDPFMGSGSTGIAAKLEGFDFIGMEMDEDYFKIANTRVESYERYRDLLKK